MTRVRRDLRAERAASAVRGAGRPRFRLGSHGQPGRLRRDPRAELKAQWVAAPKRLRLDRSQHASVAGKLAIQPTPVEEIAPKIIEIDEPAFLVAVVPDAPGGRLAVHDRQLFGAARALAGSNGGVIALVPTACEGLGEAGADRIALLPSLAPHTYDPDAAAAALADAFSVLSPRHVLFAETPNGGDLARRLALLTDEPLFSDVEIVSTKAIARAARGRRIEQRCAPTRLVSVVADATAPYAGTPREGRLHACASTVVSVGESAIVDVAEIPADPASVPLALADFVTAAGNGITDFETFYRVIAALQATPGASRVLCDAGLMPREAQVGASGTVLAATCYFALGIAGAPQHLQGVAGCEHVIAVNTDLHAAMIERAGLAIVQDAQLVMPAILAELAREAGETS